MFQSFKSFLEGAATAVTAHFTAWLLRIPIEKLYHKLLYLCGHIAATLIVAHLFENR